MPQSQKSTASSHPSSLCSSSFRDGVLSSRTEGPSENTLSTQGKGRMNKISWANKFINELLQQCSRKVNPSPQAHGESPRFWEQRALKGVESFTLGGARRKLLRGLCSFSSMMLIIFRWRRKMSLRSTSKNRKRWRQTGLRQSSPHRRQDPNMEIQYRPPRTLQSQWETQPHFIYATPVSTPHRRHWISIADTVLRTPFPRLLAQSSLQISDKHRARETRNLTHETWECTLAYSRKCPRRLLLSVSKTPQGWVPAETPKSAHGKSANLAVLTKMYTKFCLASFHMF